MLTVKDLVTKTTTQATTSATTTLVTSPSAAEISSPTGSDVFKEEEKTIKDEIAILEEAVLNEVSSNKKETKRNVPKFIVSIHPAEQSLSPGVTTSQPRKVVVSADKSDVFVYFGRENTGQDTDQKLKERRDDIINDDEFYDKVLTKYNRSS